ncbi:MAG: Vitamin B12 dependent methionine synthase activation subunit [Clostridia bacterium]|nr:Vitamin B12 dependent methionine synthase activation subunit [Clostridia bacterium]MBQ7789543.1 Vitamin B12 dependent methionine synthase activation subunit [Clostridia bacterium]
MTAPTLISISDVKALKININEVLRYLKINKKSDDIIAYLDECKELVYKNANPRGAFIRTEISVCEDIIDFGFDRVESKKLAKNLKGCKEAYAFVATLGVEIDRLFERYLKIEPSKASVCDAIASSLIESFCDYINEYLKANETLCPRFSPGYGDYSIKHQGALLNILDASKRVGITLTNSYMMVPTKSVSAIIGIKI